MAKKKSQTSAAPDQRGRKELIELTSATAREYAAELRAIAQRIDSYADDMDSLKIGKLNVLVGKWRNAMDTLNGWISKQFLTSLMVAASDLGKVIDVNFNANHGKPKR